MQEEQHKQIQAFLRVGDYSSAQNILSGTQEAQKDLDYWYYSAYVARKIEDLDGAEEFCKKAITLYPDSNDLNFELGVIYQIKGDYRKATEYLKKNVDGFSNDTTFFERMDVLNSLALTYKKAKDTDNAFKYYNIALETLVQELYDWVKSSPIQEVGEPPDTHPTSTSWIDLAMQIAIKNSAQEGFEKALFPTAETAVKLVQQNPLVGRVFYDEGKTRYLLPAYFNTFAEGLKSNVWYSTITNNIALLYADTAEIRKAGEVFMESIDFIPPDSTYNAPIVNFSDLQAEYGTQYWEQK
ncbi:MAG: hypothetical protein A2481_02460 [Candidatus Yonathbacteria bacterium RIFOXYC2_FULL_47_9]|nr:MAG: hypothetical protein A2481_02460 [Candidatus Yonathbacteria bacterium RIFOXYC2_FULL_47_9]HAT68561.1 hypothetical protein [Candidatus Yonathbacteria bacterium]